MEFRKTTDLKPHPKSSEYFKDIKGQDFDDLVQSLKEHGVIEPLVIYENGIILCGRQRWRAAKKAGIKKLPVVVRKCPSPEEEEAIIIEENIRRRQLSTSETARAIKRLYEIYGIERKPGRPKEEDEKTVGRRPFFTFTRSDIAEQTGLKETQVKVYRTLANLIPEILGLLDAKKITQKVAYQLAQLPAGDQKTAYNVLTSEIVKLSVEEVKRYRLNLQEKNLQISKQWDQIKELQEQLNLLSQKESEAKNELTAKELVKIQHEKTMLIMQIEKLKEDIKAIKEEKEKTLEEIKDNLKEKEQENFQITEENEKLKEELKKLKKNLKELAFSKEASVQVDVLLFCLEAVDTNLQSVMKIIYDPKRPYLLNEEREELKTKLSHTQNLISSALKELEKIHENALKYYPPIPDADDSEEGLLDDS